MTPSLAIHTTTAQSGTLDANESESAWVVSSRAAVLIFAPVAFAARSAPTTATTCEGLALRIATRSTVRPSIAGRPVMSAPILSARAGSPVAT